MSEKRVGNLTNNQPKTKNIKMRVIVYYLSECFSACSTATTITPNKNAADKIM